MRKHITTVILVGALSTVPVVGFAAAQGKTQSSTAAKHVSTNTAVTHATSGVVKSIDASTLVITRTGKTRGEMRFALNPSTQREGTIAVGAPVSVRYSEEGKTRVATAVRVQQTKQQAAHKTPKR